MKFNFNPNYITSDGIFEVEVDINSLTYETASHPQKWVTAADSTSNFVNVYNTLTNNLSTKSCYLNSKGLYFKGNKKRYFIKDLKLITK